MNIISINKSASHSFGNRTKNYYLSFSLLVVTWLSFCSISSASAVNISYSITYDDGVVFDMPVDIADKTLNPAIPISSNSPTLSGKKFLGWCSGIVATTDGTDTCTGGIVYQPSSNLSIDQTGSGNNFHFYAMWQEEKTIANSTTMQEVASCPDSLPTGQIYTIKDSRDNTEYHTAKLADGNCWLLDNLALDLTDSTVLNGMNENNTHASNTTLDYLKGTTTRDPSTDADGQYATAGVTNWTSDYSYSAPLVNMDDKNKTAPSGTSSDPMQSQATSGGWKYGGYYNYCAASAGFFCYGNGTSKGTSSGSATEDICPKGWRMPTGGSSGEYQALYNNASYNTYDNYRNALRLPLSGDFYDDSANEQGSYGGFWSSNRSGNYNARILYIDTSTVDPASNYGRNLGRPVRCVLGS